MSDEDIAQFRNAGFDNAGIAEIVATVALTMFTNYFNHVAQTEVNFPEIAVLDRAPACSCG